MPTEYTDADLEHIEGRPTPDHAVHLASAYRTMRQWWNDWMDRADKAEARVAELKAALRNLLPVNPHMGACCTYDDAGTVIVTPESCKCYGPWKIARMLLGWTTGLERVLDSVSAQQKPEGLPPPDPKWPRYIQAAWGTRCDSCSYANGHHWVKCPKLPAMPYEEYVHPKPFEPLPLPKKAEVLGKLAGPAPGPCTASRSSNPSFVPCEQCPSAGVTSLAGRWLCRACVDSLTGKRSSDVPCGEHTVNLSTGDQHHCRRPSGHGGEHESTLPDREPYTWRVYRSEPRSNEAPVEYLKTACIQGEPASRRCDRGTQGCQAMHRDWEIDAKNRNLAADVALSRAELRTMGVPGREPILIEPEKPHTVDERVFLAEVREVERLRNVIRTGGAMYRAERASVGVPGGNEVDSDNAKPMTLSDVPDSICPQCGEPDILLCGPCVVAHRTGPLPPIGTKPKAPAPRVDYPLIQEWERQYVAAIEKAREVLGMIRTWDMLNPEPGAAEPLADGGWLRSIVDDALAATTLRHGQRTAKVSTEQRVDYPRARIEELETTLRSCLQTCRDCGTFATWRGRDRFGASFDERFCDACKTKREVERQSDGRHVGELTYRDWRPLTRNIELTRIYAASAAPCSANPRVK